MSLAAIRDAQAKVPEIINEKMTFVLMVYSSLFAYWAWVMIPRNSLLCACHITSVLAQSNQMRRLYEHRQEEGDTEGSQRIATISAAVVGAGVTTFFGGNFVKDAAVTMNLGPVSTLAGAAAGPSTVHFWAPISKWMISGASFIDLNLPPDKISLNQYTALTLTEFFFSRYALLVTPINYMLCSVNVALFLSSAYHLGLKVNADYIEKK
mmetsp:Transcript_15763/g.24510  ORF Transcript_15763/g.24510 Transcript_15763/m.24510 type:complete len:209 (-) Transcript_15763:197-823(-)